ncbi:MAG: class I SAM-dependent methyltransferase [Candidatus Brocadiaceae bacterium]|nr:class I SAM-dependent methyltransferase [Candidatus Brocadiaceae bacterium]
MTRPRSRISIGDCLDAPAAKRVLNERLFTAIAAEYARVSVGLSFGRDAAWKRRLVRALPRVARPACVDIACGTGDLTRLLARRFPDGGVAGIDLTPAMLVRARAATCEANVRYEVGDMMSLPLPDASADLATGGYALRNAPDLQGAISEVARILRVGGHAAFLEFVHWPGRLSGGVELFVLGAWCGLWGLLVHGNPQVYGYIAASLRRFPTPAGLVERFERAGLRTVKMIPCLFGIMSILLLRKERSP